MKSNPLFNPLQLFVGTLLALSFAFATPLLRASAQTRQAEPAEVTSAQVSNAQAAPAESTSTAAETDAAQKRLTRARSLAAIGKLAAAAGELESLRAATKDESVREVTRVLLMAIFVEMPDYAHATSLLDEAFKARTAGQTADEATHSYFALAGQTVNAVRTHLERYRSFGVNVADAAELPAEAAGDIEQLRGLLERVVEQAKSLHEEQIKGGNEGTRGLDAAALLEDAATVRMRLSRHDEDRALWQSVVSDARRHLFSSEMRIASISEIPSARPAPVPPAPSAKQPAPDKPAPASRTEQKSSDASRNSSKKSRPPANEPSKQPAASTANAQPAAPASGSAQPQGPATGTAGPTTGGAPVAVGALVGKAKQRVSPSYPSLARTARISGVVTVFLLINEKGEVESVQRTDGPQQLQQAATDAARRWKFNPTVIDGQPVRVTGYLSFNFAL